MGLETRKGRGAYYYRKKRIDGRVVSEYVGTGDIAILAEAYYERDRHNREAAIRLRREEREKAESIDKVVAELSETIDVLLQASLHADGFHKHKGEWRRRRGK